MSENGVKLALTAAKAAAPDAFPHRTIAELLAKHGPPISVNAIYGFEAKGYFPPDRARIIAAEYDLPIEKLVNPKFGSLLNGNA